MVVATGCRSMMRLSQRCLVWGSAPSVIARMRAGLRIWLRCVRLMRDVTLEQYIALQGMLNVPLGQGKGA